MKRITLSILLLFMMYEQISAQERKIIFEPTFRTTKLQINHPYLTLQGDSIEISSLRFYISDIELLKNGTMVCRPAGTHHLIDEEVEESKSITYKSKAGLEFNEISFNLGIDSATHSLGAMGGDLDPTKGMYWTWQNGYINFKLEGKSSKSNARNQEFQFHIGGYSGFFNTLQHIRLPLNNREEIKIEIAIDKILNDLDLSKLNHIMSPGVEAVNLSKLIAAIFTLKN